MALRRDGSPWFGVACAVALVSLGSSPQAAEPKDLEPFLTHLEFQGYTCRIEEGEILARHATRSNLVVKPMGGGFLVRSGYLGKGKDDLPREAYALVNELNAEATAARFYWGPEGRLFVEAWFVGPYDKQRFAALLDVWNADSALLSKKRSRLVPFLG